MATIVKLLPERRMQISTRSLRSTLMRSVFTPRPQTGRFYQRDVLGANSKNGLQNRFEGRHGFVSYHGFGLPLKVGGANFLFGFHRYPLRSRRHIPLAGGCQRFRLRMPNRLAVGQQADSLDALL